MRLVKFTVMRDLTERFAYINAYAVSSIEAHGDRTIVYMDNGVSYLIDDILPEVAAELKEALCD